MLKNIFTKENLPRLALVFVLIGYIWTITFYDHWKTPEGKNRKVIKYDVISYYSYLPATFIYGDATLGFLDEGKVRNDNKFWYVKMDNGNRLIVTSMGLSYLYAPFFFTAHVLAPVFNQPRDGYSDIYQLFLIISGAFYSFLGLILLARFLRKYFDPLLIAITIFAIGLGTNLFFYSSTDPAMPHSHNFFLITLFMYLVTRWYEKPVWYNAVFTGLVFGIITLVRPTNILVFFFLLLYGVTSWKSFGERIVFYIQKWSLLLLMIFVFLLPWIPQFLYWKEVTGHFIYFTYAEKNASFDFLHPHIWESLFSFRKGWLIYTPIMFFALAGIPLLYKHYRSWFYALLIYIVFMIYVQSSWWCWWFGGGFGLRTYISAYPLLAFPLALMLRELKKKKMAYFIAGTSLVLLLTAYQVFQSRQFTSHAIHWSGTTFESYKENFLKYKPTKASWKMLEMPDYPLARLGIHVVYSTSENNEEWRNMDKELAYEKIRQQIAGDKKVNRQIERYANKENISVDSVETIVLDRMYLRRTK